MTIETRALTTPENGIDFLNCPMDELPLPGNVYVSTWQRAAVYVAQMTGADRAVGVTLPTVDGVGRELLDAIRRNGGSEQAIRQAISLVTYRESCYIEDGFTSHPLRRVWRFAMFELIAGDYQFRDQLLHPQITDTITDLLIARNQQGNWSTLIGVGRDEIRAVVGDVVVRAADVPIGQLPHPEDVRTMLTINKLRANFIKGLALQFRSPKMREIAPELDVDQVEAIYEMMKEYQTQTTVFTVYNTMMQEERWDVVRQMDDLCLVVLRGLHASTLQIGP